MDSIDRIFHCTIDSCYGKLEPCEGQSDNCHYHHQRRGDHHYHDQLRLIDIEGKTIYFEIVLALDERRVSASRRNRGHVRTEICGPNPFYFIFPNPILSLY